MIPPACMRYDAAFPPHAVPVNPTILRALGPVGQWSVLPYVINSLQSRLVQTQAFGDNMPWMGPLAPWMRKDSSYDDDKARNWFLICVVVSILLHIGLGLLAYKEHIDMTPPPSGGQGPIAVRLSPIPHPPPPKSEPEKAAATPQHAPVMATHTRSPTRPTFVVPVQPEKPVLAQPSAQTVPPDDMASHLRHRQEQREEQEAEAAQENAAAAAANNGLSTDQIIANNLNRAKRSANDGTGGVFQITSVGVREGAFRFNGWNPARDNWHESYTVDAGEGGDVKLAIVKKVIEVIRKYKKGDFEFESHKLGRMVPMSARPQDNDRLENFLLMELFSDEAQVPRKRS
jgi:hypothetical protein